MNKTLLRKELRPLLLETLLAGLIGGVSLAFFGEWGLSLGHPSPNSNEGLPIYAFTALFTGLSLGAWHFHVERMFRTETYLHHRATGVSGAFWAKVLAAWIAFVVLGVEILGIYAAWVRVGSDWGGAAEWSRFLDYGAVGALAFSGHAIGAWAFHLPRSNAVRLGAAILGGCSLFVISAFATIRSDGGPAGEMPRFLVLQAVVCAVFLVLARRLADARPEPERPLRANLSLAQAPFAFVLLGFPILIFATNMQDVALKSTRRERVLLVEDSAGKVHAVRRISGGSSDGFVRLDPTTGAEEPIQVDPILPRRGEPTTGTSILFDSSTTPLAWASETTPELARRFGGKRFDLSNARVGFLGGDVKHPLGWFDSVERVVQAYRWDGDRPMERIVLGKGPDATPFSERTLPLWGEATVAFFDPEDSSTWALRRENGVPRLEAAPLPHGERAVALDRIQWTRRVRAGLLEPYGVSDYVALRGESKTWRWSDEGWIEFVPGQSEVLESRVADTRAFLLRRANNDALWPSIAVLDARTGERVLTLEDSRTPSLRATAALCSALSLTRPPVFAVWAAARPAADLDRPFASHDRLVRDVALQGGSRSWLLLLHAGLAAACAFGAWRHLRRVGSSRAVRWTWTLLALAFGPAALLALSIIEPRRPSGTVASKPAADAWSPDRAHPHAATRI